MKSSYRFIVILPVFILTILSLTFINFSQTTLLSTIIFYILIYPFALNLSHRGIAHRQINFTPLGEKVIGVLLLFSLRGDPISFALAHRYHHRYADTEKDFFSPSNGLLRCFFSMFTNLDISLSHYQVLIKDYFKDKYRFYWFLFKYKSLIIWSTFALISLISIHVAIGLILASVFSFIIEQISMTFFEHSVSKKEPYNNVLWSKFTLTEYHADHHHNPGNPGDKDPGSFLKPLCIFLKLAK